MDIIKKIAEELEVKTSQVDAAVKLIDEGCTIPFIARYRKEVDNNNKDIYLKIDTNNLRRTFSYSYNDKDYNKVVSLDNVYYLCDEGIRKGKRFTGAMIGMYAYAGDYGSQYTDSEGRHGTDDYYAAFDYFRYKA